jgi:hypothetical protein
MGDVVGDRDRIGDEAVKRNESRKRGKKREQEIECCSGSDEQNPVLADFPPDAPANIPPSRRGNSGRPVSVATAASIELSQFGFRRHRHSPVSSLLPQNSQWPHQLQKTPSVQPKEWRLHKLEKSSEH